MEPSGSSPSRPRSLQLGSGSDPTWKSTTPSPSSEAESRTMTSDIEKYEELKEYMQEVDEILDYLKPFPRREVEKSDAQSPKKLDHLENLIRLVEQLKELKEKNYESQQRNRVMRETHERSRKSRDQMIDIPPPPPDPPKKHRPSLPFRKGSRSKSIGTPENLVPERLFVPRKSMSSIKSKVSKWTKVKEAFRWEKATVMETRFKHGKKENFEEDLAIVVESPVCDFLQVPEKCGESSSPADSVLSGHLSSCSSLGATSFCHLASSGYSGDHSHSSVGNLDQHVPRLSQTQDYLAQSLQELPSSPEDDKMDEATSNIGECIDCMIYMGIGTKKKFQLEINCHRFY